MKGGSRHSNFTSCGRNIKSNRPSSGNNSLRSLLSGLYLTIPAWLHQEVIRFFELVESKKK
jgi:hypothetical protein